MHVSRCAFGNLPNQRAAMIPHDATAIRDADGFIWTRQGNTQLWSLDGVNAHAVGCPTTLQLESFGPFKVLCLTH